MADVNVDNIWSALGSFGKYQIKQIVYYSVVGTSATYAILVYVFAGYTPQFSCKLPSNDSWLYKSLNETRDNTKLVERACGIAIVRNDTNLTKTDAITSLPCEEGYNYNIIQHSIVTEWDLVCSHEGKVEFTQSVVTIGQIIGALVFMPLADIFGRKKIYFIMGVMLLLSTTLITLSPNYSIYVFMKFLSGAFIEGCGMVFYTYVYEMYGDKYRCLFSVFTAFLWTGGVMSLTLFGYGLQNYSWRYLHLSTGCVGLFNLFTYWLGDESLRWLLANGKTNEARKLIKHICKENKKNPDEILPLLSTNHEVNMKNFDKGYNQDGNLEQHNHLCSEPDVKKAETPSLIDILRHRLLLKITLIWLLTWFTNSITYYGLLLSSVHMAGNRFLNYFINGVVEMPSNLLFLLLVNRVSRRSLTIGSHLLAGIPMIISAILITFKDMHEMMETGAIVCSFIGKMGITLSYCIIFVYVPETYPTNLRNIGFGLASAAAHIGGIVAPYSSLLSHHIAWGPGVIFGACCLMVSFACLFLPETANKPLPQTIAELEMKFSKKPTHDID